MSERRMLDICAGRLGWAKAFLARGWQVTAVDLVEPPEIPPGVTFIKLDVLKMRILKIGDLRYWTTEGDEPNPFWEHPRFDFVCASTPCEEFSVWGMRHFHPNPKPPDNGIRLFDHVRQMCEAAGVPYVMENVRAARQFVGKSEHHCGPFHLWGNAVPPLMPQGIIKGMTREAFGFREFKGSPNWNRKHVDSLVKFGSKSIQRKEATAKNATIPPELASCVADYACRITESKAQPAIPREEEGL